LLHGEGGVELPAVPHEHLRVVPRDAAHHRKLDC
jgi:hypothetical protein